MRGKGNLSFISHFFLANGGLLLSCKEQAAATPGLKRHSTVLAEAGMTIDECVCSLQFLAFTFEGIECRGR